MSIDILRPVPPPNLPAEDVEALRNVDLRLSFGNHGYTSVIENHGWAILALTDTEYALAASLITDLDADHGDVFAQEGTGHTHDSPVDTLFSGLRLHLADSPHVSNSDLSLLDERATATANEHSNDSLDAKLSVLWEKLRRYQLIDPVHYAAGLASDKGIATYYADASAEDLYAWWTETDKSIERWPKVISPLLPLVGLRFDLTETRFRDTKTVERLGSIASRMKQVTDERPVLTYMGGSAHQKSIEGIFREYGVPFQASTYYPNRKNRLRFDTARNIAHLLFRHVDSSHENYKRLWLANTQA